jgi:hypothetical protein
VVGHVHARGMGRYLKGLCSEPKEQRPLVRPRHSWEYNFKMDPRDIGIDGTNLIRLAQDIV